MDGIELAEVLQKDYHIPVVFLTANVDEETFRRARATSPYAFKAKPFKKLDLPRTLELAVEFVKNNRHITGGEPTSQGGSVLKDRIFIFRLGKKIKIMFKDIIFIEAERNYCRIITSSEKYLLTMHMKNLEASLSDDVFQRVHRSYIVNLNYVDEIDESTIVLNGHVLGLSKSYRKEFLQRIKSV